MFTKNMINKINSLNKKYFSSTIYDLAVIGAGPGGKYLNF